MEVGGERRGGGRRVTPAPLTVECRGEEGDLWAACLYGEYEMGVGYGRCISGPREGKWYIGELKL